LLKIIINEFMSGIIPMFNETVYAIRTANKRCLENPVE
jgi:hypothetical protein